MYVAALNMHWNLKLLYTLLLFAKKICNEVVCHCETPKSLKTSHFIAGKIYLEIFKNLQRHLSIIRIKDNTFWKID